MRSAQGTVPGTVERAYQLAQSGTCRSLGEVIGRLKQERHDCVEAHLAGPSIRRALRNLCALNADVAETEPEPKAQTGS